MRWISRALLCVLGILLLTQWEINIVWVAALVSAIICCCLMEFFSNRAATVILCIAWTVLCLFFPVFVLFWPVVLFDSCRMRLYALAVLPVVCLAVDASALSTPVLSLCIFGNVLGGYLGVRCQKEEHLAQELRSIRDTSKETTLALSRKNKELLEKQAYEIRIATLTERGRIAREIHDNVGHMLARALMQTGAVIATSKDEPTTSALDGIKATLTEAMNNVRESVHGMRDQAFDLRGIVESCIRDFSAFGCQLHYDLSQDAPRDMQYCFAAVIREAFANVQKHSDATRIRIDIQEHPAFYKLVFQDNGTRKPRQSNKQEGMGLANMRERTAALGGQFYTQMEKGFRIHITIPRGTGENT